MARKTDASGATGEGAGGRRGGGLAALVLLTLLSLAVGGAGGLYLASAVEDVVSARAEAEPEAASRALRYTGDTRLLRLEPVVANLGRPTDVWVRLQTAIVFENGDLPNPEATAALLAQDILAYLRTVTIEQLEGPSALLFLREDLNDRVAIRTDGRVSELVVESMVVQ